jgi:hypothetical protein
MLAASLPEVAAYALMHACIIFLRAVRDHPFCHPGKEILFSSEICLLTLVYAKKLEHHIMFLFDTCFLHTSMCLWERGEPSCLKLFDS